MKFSEVTFKLIFVRNSLFYLNYFFNRASWTDLLPHSSMSKEGSLSTGQCKYGAVLCMTEVTGPTLSSQGLLQALHKSSCIDIYCRTKGIQDGYEPAPKCRVVLHTQDNKEQAF